jgi:hypothetical protein
LLVSQTVVLSLVASASKLFMNAFSTLLVENGKALDSALQRPAGQPLITVSNHVAVKSYSPAFQMRYVAPFHLSN